MGRTIKLKKKTLLLGQHELLDSQYMCEYYSKFLTEMGRSQWACDLSRGYTATRLLGIAGSSPAVGTDYVVSVVRFQVEVSG